MLKRAFLPGAIALALVTLISGCGSSGPTRVHVAGEVTYLGKPLPAGVILLEPDVSKGADGPQGFAHIKDGKFDTRENGRMACAGPNVASIQGYDGKSKNQENPLGTALFTSYTHSLDIPANGNAPIVIAITKKD